MPFDLDRVSDILVCPSCHSEFVVDGDALVDVSPECRRSFPVVDNIPRLLVSESTELSTDDWSAAMSRSNRNTATGKPNE